MQTDNVGFVTKLAKILGISEDEVGAKVGALNLDQAMDVVAAVSAGDDEKARELMQSAEPETAEPEAVDATDEEDEKPAEPLDADSAGTDVEAFDASALKFGDAVTVNGQPGVVKIPHGRDGKVGVLVGGKIERVAPGEIAAPSNTVTEAARDLSRMLSLAGVSPATALAPEAVTTVIVGDCPAPEGDVRCVLERICEIEKLIPNLRLSDANIVRKRLTSLVSAMNEAAAPRNRKV